MDKEFEVWENGGVAAFGSAPIKYVGLREVEGNFIRITLTDPLSTALLTPAAARRLARQLNRMAKRTYDGRY